MKRTAHYDGDNPAELSFPASGIDIFATLLLVVMVNHPAFHVNRQKLPVLQPKPATAPRPVDGRSGYRIELKGDGTVAYEGKPVSLDGLARRLAAEPHRDRPIQVSLETTPDGRGAMQAWIQLQSDLTEAKLWNRVQVLTRFKQPRKSKGGTEP